MLANELKPSDSSPAKTNSFEITIFSFIIYSYYFFTLYYYYLVDSLEYKLWFTIIVYSKLLFNKFMFTKHELMGYIGKTVSLL